MDHPTARQLIDSRRAFLRARREQLGLPIMSDEVRHAQWYTPEFDCSSDLCDTDNRVLVCAAQLLQLKHSADIEGNEQAQQTLAELNKAYRVIQGFLETNAELKQQQQETEEERRRLKRLRHNAAQRKWRAKVRARKLEEHQQQQRHISISSSPSSPDRCVSPDLLFC